MTERTVAIIVPAPPGERLTEDENISLRHLEHFLGRYDRYLVAPKVHPLELPGFNPMRFDSKFFGSTEAHTRLMLSDTFYRAFAEYEFILIYHLDALVFSDDLQYWCSQGLDYVGAPWLTDHRNPERGFKLVGNGGFSLRRVEAFRGVLGSKKYTHRPADYWRRNYGEEPPATKALNFPKRWLKHLNRFNGPRWHASRFELFEDLFWSRYAVHYRPDFRAATVEQGLRFAFECAPRYCFQQAGQRLPFGAHAWARYDRAFWEPHLLDDEALKKAGLGPH